MIDLKWSFRDIPLDWIIVKDSPYDWKITQADQLLQQSLEMNGILMPLIVQEIGNQQFYLVDGFKRMSIIPCSRIKTSTLFHCLVIAPDVSFRELILWRLETEAEQHSFKGLEICRILKLLYEEGFEESQLTKQVLPRLGLKPSRKITLDLLKLAEILDLEERACLENYTAEDLLPLMKFSGAEIRLLVRHLKDIELGGNKWKSLLQLIREVSRLRGWTLVHMMESPEIVRIIQEERMQSPLRFRMLKQKLESWRFPELTASQKEFEHCLQQLQIPARTSVHYDPFFEKDDMLLKLQVGSLEELTGQLRALQLSAMQHTEWEKMFQLVHGQCSKS